MYFWAEKMVSENKNAAKHAKSGSTAGVAGKRHSLRPTADVNEAAAVARERAAAKAVGGSASGGAILINIIRAFLARALFFVHSFATIWAAVSVQEENSIWAFALIAVSIVVEGAYAILMRVGDERKWFSPSILLYILATAPPIWLLETKLCQWRQTQDVKLELLFEYQILEQLLLVVLIVGRWLLPKGNISREQLSQILLAYLAISSDIVEFFDVFKEKVVYSNINLQKIVLSAWTVSLMQFPFILTVSRARKMRVAITEDDESIHTTRRDVTKFIYDIDIWAIVVANCLQDIPFFLVRVYLIVQYKLMTYTMIFFLAKNALIIMLQFYRAVVLCNDRYLHPKSSRRGSRASVLQPPSSSREPREARRRPTLVAKDVEAPLASPQLSVEERQARRERKRERKSVPNDVDPEAAATSAAAAVSRRASAAPKVINVRVMRESSESPSKRPRSAFDKYID